MNGANKESRRAYTKIRKDKNGGDSQFSGSHFPKKIQMPISKCFLSY